MSEHFQKVTCTSSMCPQQLCMVWTMSSKRCGRSWLHKVCTLLTTSARPAFTILWAGCTLSKPAQNSRFQTQKYPILCFEGWGPLFEISGSVTAYNIHIYTMWSFTFNTNFHQLSPKRLVKQKLRTDDTNNKYILTKRQSYSSCKHWKKFVKEFNINKC
jgi:hypothetical protein